VLAVGRSGAALSELAAIARARGLPLRAARGDAGRRGRVRALLRQAAPRGAAGPDLLVVAAGDYWEGPISKLTSERWDAVVHSNVTVPLTAIQEALPGMRRRRYGRILLFGVAGADAVRSAPRAHAYRASKTALLTLARSIAHEEAAHGITVNVILPGIMRTGMAAHRAAALARKIPARRLGTPNEIARAALFLLAEESSYITGAALTISGGYLI
jgi:3-oxoacyl-[acyl-carrier protein] reductase